MAANLSGDSFPDSGTKEKQSNILGKSINVNIKNNKYWLTVLQSSLNLIGHLLMSAIVGITTFFAMTRLDFEYSPTIIHMVITTVGCQLLMAQGILTLSSDNGWSSKFKYVDKRRAHWILQIVGSLLALIGCVVETIYKQTFDYLRMFDTIHGQLGLVAMIFILLSLINGVTSLYAYELRGVVSGRFSKISHILLGTLGFVFSSASLCYGFDNISFKIWATPSIAYAMMGATILFTLIIIINPIISFKNKLS